VDKPHDRNKAKGGIKIGERVAEKSKGLFSADDWQCGKCGNVNWARRPTCNVCNGPQFNVEEERTGLGGGFNERGTVEYKERVESSDDEFDDRGRSKSKRKRLPYKRPMVPSSVPEPESEEEEEEKKVEDEEEEEDDDDDGDLSKYDLWGDDDNDKKDEAKTEEEKNGAKVAVPAAKAAEDEAKRPSPSPPPPKAKKEAKRRSRSPRFRDS